MHRHALRTGRHIPFMYTYTFTHKVQSTRLPIVSISLDLGMQVDSILTLHRSRGKTLLEYYIKKVYLAGVEYMISVGADIRRTGLVTKSIRAGHEAILMTLLHAGANPHSRNHRGPAIEQALLYGSANTVIQLLVAGAKTNSANAKCLAKNSFIDSKLKLEMITAFAKGRSCKNCNPHNFLIK